MGKKWDASGIAYNVDLWKEVLRILKPGGHLLAFGGRRTYHRMVVAIEDAGFEIRDMIVWVFATGFPKSYNISKAIDKQFGLEQKKIGKRKHPTLKDTTKINRQSSTQYHGTNPIKDEWDITKPNSDEAKQWGGWGTNLKPAFEPIVIARKPLSEKTVAANILKWGAGGINIDECRISYKDNNDKSQATPQGRCTSKGTSAIGASPDIGRDIKRVEFERPQQKGRFPSNFIHDGSDDVLRLFPDSKGQRGVLKGHNKNIKSPNGIYGTLPPRYDCEPRQDKSTSAARFFYCPKVSQNERNKGLSDSKNTHPTLKPMALMKWLITLTTRENDVVIDPFMGSGTTGVAAIELNRNFVGIEKEDGYFEIAKQRIRANKTKE